MKKTLKWIGRGALAIVALAAVAAVAVYVVSERALNRTYDVPGWAIALAQPGRFPSWQLGQ